jgi:hypothetical protein
MFRELGEALDAAEQPGLRHLAPAQLAAAAACVCDTKTAGGDTFVRLNEAKVRLQRTSISRFRVYRHCWQVASLLKATSKSGMCFHSHCARTQQCRLCLKQLCSPGLTFGTCWLRFQRGV